MFRVFLIFCGGGFGAVLRYLVQGWFSSRPIGESFPLGTLMVNLSGCLAIGFLGGLFYGPRQIHPDYRAAILIGILGGYTTFSSFGWETFNLAENREFFHACLNVVLSVVVGLAAVWLGKQAVQAMYGS